MRLPDVLPIVHFNRTTPYRQPEWIFPGLRAGQVGLLTAPGGTGKSFLLLEIAFSVASGEPMVNGLIPGAAGPVRVLNFEDDEFDLENRGNSILREFADVEPGENLFVSALSGYSLGLVDGRGGVSDEDVKWLKKQCDGMRLLILDPLSHCHCADENSAPMMSKLVQVLKGVGRETGTGILIAHHTAKAAALNGQTDLQQSARGSSALVDAARVVLTLSKPKDEDNGYALELTWAKLNGHAPIQPKRLRRQPTGVLVGDRHLLPPKGEVEIDF